MLLLPTSLSPLDHCDALAVKRHFGAVDAPEVRELDAMDSHCAGLTSRCRSASASLAVTAADSSADCARTCRVDQRVMCEARKPEGLDVGFVGNDNEIGSSLPCLQRREQVGEVGE